LAALAESPADLVLLDYYVPGADAVATIVALIALPGCGPIIVLSASLSPADRAASLGAGAVAFLTKHTDPDALLRVCEAALASVPGSVPVPVERAAADPHGAAVAMGLTPRQLDVMVMLGHGCSNREIASLLEISPETVKSHLAAIYERMGASNRTEAIAVARASGLL
jgi:DNA-binding NarL/FixJ family response regulator